MSHRRLSVLVKHLPSDSALWRELLGPLADWDLKTQLLASVEHQIRVGNWIQTKDAQSKSPRNYPVPVLPSGMTNQASDGPEVTDNTPAGTKRFGGGAMTIEETNDWLGW